MDKLDFLDPEIINSLIEGGIEALTTSLLFMFLFVAGYFIGYAISKILKRILLIDKIQQKLIKYGATTTDMWKSIVEFVAQYTIWLVVVVVLFSVMDAQLPILEDLFYFVWNLFLFIVLSVLGLLFGGISCKLLKDALVTMGFEEGLKKYNVADSFGGIPVSTILATIGKWYVFIVFVSTGLQIVSASEDFELFKVMSALMEYVPHAILGFLLILIALISSNFVSNRIKDEEVPLSDMVALGVKTVILFFGIVLALPKFGINDVSIIADSFKIIMIGISLGLAIAIGFGLRDSVTHMAKKMEKK